MRQCSCYKYQLIGILSISSLCVAGTFFWQYLFQSVDVDVIIAGGGPDEKGGKVGVVKLSRLHQEAKCNLSAEDVIRLIDEVNQIVLGSVRDQLARMIQLAY